MNETQNTQPTLLETILSAINTHIDQQVEAKLNAVMQSHTTMKQIDESFRDAIGEIAMEKVQEHDEVVHHLTDDSVREILDDSVQQEVRNQLRDHDFSNQLHDAITDYDFDDKIDGYDFDSKMDDWKDMNDILDSEQAREIVNEILDEALDERLKALLSKLSITIKGD
jgi:hypothetical protein